MNCEKHPYSHAKAIEFKRRRERENKGLQLRVYYCNQCGYWHLTSKEDLFPRNKHRQEAA